MPLTLTQLIDDDEDVIIIKHGDEELRIKLRSNRRGNRGVFVDFDGPRSFDINRAKALKKRAALDD